MCRLLAGLALFCGCSSELLPADLGEHRLDTVYLEDSLPLAHLAAAMKQPQGNIVEDLLRVRPPYQRAPDPSPWFERQHQDQQALSPLTSFDTLRVLSFNTGLLDRWYSFAVIRVPEVDARRARLPADLLRDDWDVLLLQEVWDERDVQAFVREAEQTGYLHYAGTPEGHEAHGLLILVREDLVDPDGPDERGETTFELQRDVEQFPGPGFERGYLEWSFRHATTGVVLHLYDTHTTAFPQLAPIREAQARELGLAVGRAPSAELAIVGCDFNGAAYYPEDEFGLVDGELTRDWWRNTQAYALLMHYGGLQDTHAMAGNARDVELMNGLPAFGPGWQREPLGDASRCEALVEGVTATDCNSLYFQQYAATEYPARIDFIFLGGALGRVRVLDTAIEYTEPLSGLGYERSDHYGVSATLLVSDR